MAEGWQGFTDEDLSRLKGGVAKMDPGPSPWTSRHQKAERRPKRQTDSSKAKPSVEDDRSLVDDDSKRDRRPGTASLDVVEQELPTSAKPVAVVAASSVSHASMPGDEAEKSVTNEKCESVNELLLSEDPSVQKPRLELLQKQQKEMEEQNKRMQAALQKTIKERYQKSQRETAVLRTVKEELGKLDNILSSDVSILRDEIDRACRAYNVAKKRYDVAEAEFVAAKIGLHKASDLKEQMMEHLCMIIQQSELRKASRLEELTKQLESGGEVVDGLS